MSVSRVPVSTRCDPEVWAAARAAAQGMLAHDPQYSLAQLVEDALRREVDRLTQAHHNGRPWSPAPSLRRGRRLDGG